MPKAKTAAALFGGSADGVIRVNGGNGWSDHWQGGGGGGRIAIDYNNLPEDVEVACVHPDDFAAFQQAVLYPDEVAQ